MIEKWIVLGNGEFSTAIREDRAGGDTICELPLPKQVDDKKHESRAKLMVAAPDLLESLKRLNDAYQDSLTYGKGCTCQRCHDASHLAYQSIAKATT